MTRPDPIRTDGSNPFAHYTVAKRLTAMLDNIPASGTVGERLEALRRDIQQDRPLSMFELPAPDYEWWRERFFSHASRIRAMTGRSPSAHNAEWFFFEHYLYRLIMEAVDWWSTGTDPFAGVKQNELETPAIWNRVSEVLHARTATRDPLKAHIQFCLWGNQVDLSYSEVATAAADRTPDAESIIINDFERARALFEHSTIHIICDNAGTELAADLTIADYLLSGPAESVVLHVKLHPTYVSDTVPSDVHALVHAMQQQNDPGIAALGGRLAQRLESRQLRVAPDQYWNGPDFLDALPERLEQTLGTAGLVIIKGDMNYRRMLGDSVPHATTPLSEVAARLPAPALLVRTMKGDPIAGLDQETLEQLDAEDPDWRINGKRGVVQLH